MGFKLTLIVLAVASLVISGCATIKLTESGEKVRVLAPDEVSSCREIGKSNTSVTDVVLGVARPIEALQKELTMIGRNSAARMGGDTIVPLTVIQEGQQSFVVYKCIDPSN